MDRVESNRLLEHSSRDRRIRDGGEAKGEDAASHVLCPRPEHPAVLPASIVDPARSGRWRAAGHGRGPLPTDVEYLAIRSTGRSTAPRLASRIPAHDPQETYEHVSLNGRNAVNCGPTIEPVGRQCPATKEHSRVARRTSATRPPPAHSPIGAGQLDLRPLLTVGLPNWAPQSCHWQRENSNVSLCSVSSRRAGVQPLRMRRAFALLPGIRRGAVRWAATQSSPLSAINDFIEYNAADPGAFTWPHSPFAI